MPEEIQWNWYVARTEPRKEHTAAFNLIERNIQIYLPEIPGRRLFGRKFREVPTAMLPGYLFLHLISGSEPWGIIRSINGILTADPVLRDDAGPRPIPEMALEIVRKAEHEQNEGRQSKVAKFQLGQSVTVSGAEEAFWQSFKAVVSDISKLDHKGRVSVSSNWFGRLVTLDVPVAQIKAA